MAYSALANFRQGLSNAALEDLKQLGITTKDRADKIANILYDNKHQIKSKYMTSMLKSPNMKAVSEKFNLLMNQDAIKDFHKTFSKPYLAIKNEKEKALAEAERSNPELQNEINLANQELKKIESLNTVEGIAAYLHNHKPPLGQEEAYKTKIGEYLSEEHSIDVLDSFTKGVKFSNKGFIEDLREYVAQIKIPGEAQKIERVMDSFGKNYATNHPQIFQKDEQYSAEDKASILGTATILLNTDLHNPNVKKRITLDEFLKQNDYIGIPQEFRKNIYTDVQAQEFKFSNSAKTTPDIPSVQSKPRQLRENINKIGESLTKAGKALAKFMPTLSHKKGSANLSADLPTSTPSVIPKNKKTPKGYQEL